MATIPENTQFCDACAAVDSQVPETMASLGKTLEDLAQQLAKDGDLRCVVFQTVGIEHDRTLGNIGMAWAQRNHPYGQI
jgi:hypothetical protein